MESFFELNPFEIDDFLPSIKKNLQSQDESLQLKNIESILRCFVSAESGGREILLTKLNGVGVMPVLLTALHSLNDRLLSCILELLMLAKDCRSFYIGVTATLAVKALINVSFCRAKSTAEAAPILVQCLVTMSAILKNRVACGESLGTICTQILPFVKFMYVSQNDKNLRLLATKLLNITLANAPDQEQEDIEVLDRCLEALKFTQEVIVCKDDNASVIGGLATLCSTCAFGSRYCTFEKSQENVKSAEIQLRKESLGMEIYYSITNTIIPQATKLDFDNEDIEFHSNFVASLRGLYNLEYCNHENLSSRLAANGYLKYFLRLSVNCSTLTDIIYIIARTNLRQAICVLLPLILRSLEEMSAPFGESPIAFVPFSNAVHELLSLPKNPNYWFFPGRTQTNCHSTLLALIYHHYRETHEAEVISYEYFASKLKAVQEEPQLSWQALRVLWFLLAVVYTRQEMSRSDPYYSLAIKRLISALKQSNLSDCYTHHIDLMRFSLGCSEFPIDLQRDVLRLWLLRFNGDVKPLLQLNGDKVLQHCLFIALNTHHQDSRLASIVNIVRELLNENNAVDVTKSTWEILPQLLSNYHPDKNECLKLLLELTIVANTNTLPMSTIQDAADEIVKIVLRMPTDKKLRTLLIRQAHVLLDESLTRNAIQVLETYVGTHDFLQTLWNDASAMENLELTVTCLKLSVLIVQSQQTRNILCEQPVEVGVQALAELLFRGRNTAEVRTSGLLLLLEFWNELDEEPAIRLAKINPDSEEAEAIFELLEVLYIATGKVEFHQKGLVYHCLMGLFDFCHRRAKNLMHPLCTILTTCSVIDYVFEMDQVSNDFLHFVSCWLSYRARFCIAEGRWRPTSLCKTPYEETVDRIKEYVEKQGDDRWNAAYCKLHSALSKIL